MMKNENIKVEKVRASHRKIYTDIIIDASPEKVWSVIIDTKSYKDWATFLVNIKGSIKEDEKITVTFKLDDKKDKLTTIDHTISVHDSNEFFWAEKGPGGIRDNHHFKVESAENGKSKFIQSDEIIGGVTWLMGGRLSKMYARGYKAFNRSLKTEVEKRFK